MVNEEKLMVRLKERGVDAKIVDVEKNNGVMFHGVSIQAGNMCPTLYFANHKDENEMFEACMKSISEKPKLDFAFNQFPDYEQIKNQLILRLSGHPRTDLIRTPVLCDLWATVHANVGEGAYLGITEIIANIWGKTRYQVFEDALESTKKKEPAIFRPLNQIIFELTNVELAEENANLYVLSNKDYFYGASAILYANGLPDEFIAFPSSVHEFIILYPIVPGLIFENLADMVKEINETTVEQEEVLSNNIYKYHKGNWEVIG